MYARLLERRFPRLRYQTLPSPLAPLFPNRLQDRLQELLLDQLSRKLPTTL